VKEPKNITEKIKLIIDDIFVLNPKMSEKIEIIHIMIGMVKFISYASMKGILSKINLLK